MKIRLHDCRSSTLALRLTTSLRAAEIDSSLKGLFQGRSKRIVAQHANCELEASADEKTAFRPISMNCTKFKMYATPLI